jgi:hypothetical protein
MTKPSLSHAIQIVANIGVIAGIVFLAIELRQNNEVLTAEARLQRAQTRIDGLTEALNNPDLVRARLTDSRRGELTAEERYLLELFWEITLNRWQYVHGEMQAGLVDPGDIPVAGWKRTMSTYPSFYAAWEQAKSTAFRKDFVTWMEQNVVEPSMAQSSVAVPAASNDAR